jgi:hypothetical protein
MKTLGLLSIVVGAMVLAATPISLHLSSAASSFLSVDRADAQASSTTPAPSTSTAPAHGTYGMQRRHERRTGRYERRDERRDDRVERRTGSSSTTTTGSAPASK